MPVCGHCSKRGRPNECTWDIFQPANDVFLPPTIARTSELEHLADRLAHVEAYLKTLPPNFALFRPLAAIAPANAESSTRNVAAKAERELEDGYSDVSMLHFSSVLSKDLKPDDASHWLDTDGRRRGDSRERCLQRPTCPRPNIKSAVSSDFWTPADEHKLVV